MRPFHEPDEAPQRLSLTETDEAFPDHDYPSTWDTLATGYAIDHDDRVFTLEAVPIAEVDPFQLADDPADEDGEAKIKSLIQSIRAGALLPPVYVIHHPTSAHPYYLIEGKHRFNAHYREGKIAIVAWVAHIPWRARSNRWLHGQPTYKSTKNSVST